MPGLWSVADDYPEEYFGEVDSDAEIRCLSMIAGERVSWDDTDPLTVRFPMASAGRLCKFGQLLTWLSVRLIAPPVVEVLKNSASDDVQLFQTIVVAKDKEVKSYFAMNVTKKIKCVDLSRSKYTTAADGGVLSVARAFFLPGCLDGVSIARDAAEPSSIVVADDLMEQLLALSLPGIAFRREGEY